jgi:drug/metabolite transporter (DMT)-like permease
MVHFIEQWIGTAWGVFGIVWLAAAFASKRSIQRQTYGSRVTQSLLLLTGLIFIFDFFGSFTHTWLNTRVTPLTAPWVLFGAALTVAGILFCFWARAILGRNWSGTVTVKTES